MSLRILGPIALALCLIIVPASGAATPTPDAAQRADTAAALFSAAAVKYPKTKRRLPASIARAFKKAGPRIKAFSAKVEATPFKPDRRKKKKKKKAKASAAGPTMTVSGGSFTTGGVKVEMGAEVRETPSGNREGDLVISFTKGVDRVETRTENSPHRSLTYEKCPTAEGQLPWQNSFWSRTSIRMFKRGKLKGAFTQKITGSIAGDGWVGTDARYQRFAGKAKVKFERYGRGEQIVIDSGGTVSAERSGDPRADSVDGSVSVKIAGLSRAEDRAAERAGAVHAKAQGIKQALAAQADLAREFQLRAEYRWYSLPNFCATATLTPVRPRLASGETMSVDGVVKAENGAVARGTFAAPTATRGSLSTLFGDFDASTPASFHAVAASPASDNTTVEAEVIGTSTAGRAIGKWSAEDQLELPQQFVGDVTSRTSGPGRSYEFDGNFIFNLTEVYTGDNGYVAASYLLAGVSDLWAMNDFGYTCHHRGETTALPDDFSGWVDIRRYGNDDPWIYSLRVDVSHDVATYNPINCDEGAEPSQRSMLNRMYTGPSGNPTRYVEVGSSTSQMYLAATAQSVPFGPVPDPTVASWDLTGS